MLYQADNGSQWVVPADRPVASKRPADLPPRMILSTFYEYGKVPGPSTEVKKVRSRWPDLATRNAFYALTQNKYAAGVVVIEDLACFNELHCILTRDINGNINTNFKRDPLRPKLLMTEEP